MKCCPRVSMKSVLCKKYSVSSCTKRPKAKRKHRKSGDTTCSFNIYNIFIHCCLSASFLCISLRTRLEYLAKSWQKHFSVLIVITFPIFSARLFSTENFTGTCEIRLHNVSFNCLKSYNNTTFCTIAFN